MWHLQHDLEGKVVSVVAACKYSQPCEIFTTSTNTNPAVLHREFYPASKIQLSELAVANPNP